MSYKTLSKVCAAISISPFVYLLLSTHEVTNFGWSVFGLAVFFVFLAFSILCGSLDEQEKEIATLRSPKDNRPNEAWDTFVEKRREAEIACSDPFSQVPDDPTNPRRQFLTEIQKEMKKGNQSPQNNDKK